MANVAVVGAQWGDEGKGKITDLLAERADVIVRYGGGNNAGHTVIVGDRTLKLHLVPSGILYPHVRCFVGNGTVLDPEAFVAELDGLWAQDLSLDNLSVSPLAHVIMPYHKLLDRLEEERRANKIGTTGRGIGPAYGDKYLRRGFRVMDLLKPERFRKKLEEALVRVNETLVKVYGHAPLSLEPMATDLLEMGERLRPHVADTSLMLHEAVKRGDRVLFEGAQGVLLDIDMGTYPFVTSSYPVAGGAAVGTGVGPGAIDRVLGIAKAYATRVGGGPFPTELFDETGDRLRDAGHEYGTTTGRPRRCGWFDAVALRLAARASGLDALCITKLDVLDGFDEIKVAVAYRLHGETITELPYDAEELAACEPIYETWPGWQEPTGHLRRFEELPAKARTYLERLEELTGVPIAMVSVGADRAATMIRTDLFA
ncbi:adenylosuccinate synthase [bacterium]|nr:adenylosuccinate synthase [bacterium]